MAFRMLSQWRIISIQQTTTAIKESTMNRIFAVSVALAVLLALGGCCCWPGHHRYGGYGYGGGPTPGWHDRSDYYDQYRQGRGGYYNNRYR